MCLYKTPVKAHFLFSQQCVEVALCLALVLTGARISAALVCGVLGQSSLKPHHAQGAHPPGPSSADVFLPTCALSCSLDWAKPVCLLHSCQACCSLSLTSPERHVLGQLSYWTQDLADRSSSSPNAGLVVRLCVTQAARSKGFIFCLLHCAHE